MLSQNVNYAPHDIRTLCVRNLSPGVKEMLITEYDSSKKSGFMKFKMEFDSSGRLITEAEFDFNGNQKYSTGIKYDHHGNISERIIKRGKEIVVTSYENIYSDLNMLQEVKAREKDKIIFSERYLRVSDSSVQASTSGVKNSKTVTFTNGIKTAEVENGLVHDFLYDDHGFLYEINTRYPGQKRRSKKQNFTNKYDNQKRIIEIQSSAGKISFGYESDKKGFFTVDYNFNQNLKSYKVSSVFFK